MCKHTNKHILCHITLPTVEEIVLNSYHERAKEKCSHVERKGSVFACHMRVKTKKNTEY